MVQIKELGRMDICGLVEIARLIGYLWFWVGFLQSKSILSPTGWIHLD